MLVPGYFLAVTETHLLSMAEAESDKLAASQGIWIDEVMQQLRPAFGEYLAFERGSCAWRERHMHRPRTHPSRAYGENDA